MCGRSTYWNLFKKSERLTYIRVGIHSDYIGYTKYEWFDPLWVYITRYTYTFFTIYSIEIICIICVTEYPVFLILSHSLIPIFYTEDKSSFHIG